MKIKRILSLLLAIVLLFVFVTSNCIVSQASTITTNGNGGKKQFQDKVPGAGDTLLHRSGDGNVVLGYCRQGILAVFGVEGMNKVNKISFVQIAEDRRLLAYEMQGVPADVGDLQIRTDPVGDGTDGIKQVAVPLFSALPPHQSRLGVDQALLLKLTDVLCNAVVGSVNVFADRGRAVRLCGRQNCHAADARGDIRRLLRLARYE